MSTDLFFFCIILAEMSPPKYDHSPFVYTEMLMDLWSYP